MPLDFLAPGETPVDGYECVEKLDSSAFSAHWLVRAPDGSTRLWKAVDLVNSNMALETRNLELLLGMRHPSLNTLLTYHSLPEEKALIFETAAPNKTLLERFHEFRTTGRQGIPGHELLGYFRQAAEGLDFLNTPQHEFQGRNVAVYHRDLKPETLYLFEDKGHAVCRVADFGLAKPISEQNANHSQGLLNYDYDPPEFYEGSASTTSDQYSFAIVYYQLRTGALPFKGSMLDQLSARLNETPDLTALPQAEQDALRKALSKNPKRRYATCSELVEALAAAMTEDKERPQESASAILKPASAWGGKATSRSGSAAGASGARPASTLAGGSMIFRRPNANAPGGSGVAVAPESPAAAMPGVTIRRPPERLVPSVQELVDEAGDEDISGIVAGAPKSANMPKSTLLRKRPPVQSIQLTRSSDDRVPLVWVVIIALMVLSAVAVIAKELVAMRGTP